MSIAINILSAVLKSAVNNKIGNELTNELIGISIDGISEKGINMISDYIDKRMTKINYILSKENMESMNIPEENIDFVVAEIKDLLSKVKITDEVFRHCKYDSMKLSVYLWDEYRAYKDVCIECESDIKKVVFTVAYTLVELLREGEQFEKDFLIQISNSVDDTNVEMRKISEYMQENFNKLDINNQEILIVLRSIIKQIQDSNTQNKKQEEQASGKTARTEQKVDEIRDELEKNISEKQNDVQSRVMKQKSENPKVFISYAWGNEEYQNKVLAFASRLRNDGIDTVFDKWDLTEGNDTYAFMEKCVTDPSVTNVLMLIDPIYAMKADNHYGGVGTETQIISNKIYKEVTQDKFIPIIMERDENGSVCKPTFLQGRLHFDLSIKEDYDNTYQRLVKKLYGEEVYRKPELGKKPSWVDKSLELSLISQEKAREDNKKIKYMQLTFFINGLTKSIKILGKVTKIGRDSSNDIVINDITVSRKQCQIVYENDIFILENYSPANTTRLNGKIVKKSKEIKCGDVVEIGNVAFTFDSATEAG